MTSLFALIALAASPVYNDGRDAWSLLDQKLVNRQVFEQLDQTRLGAELDWLALASDASLGGQLAFAGSELSRFHGYYILDTFAGLRALPGLDVNLNLTLFNPSASDGYRVSSQVYAGVAFHLYRDLGTVGGEPVRVEFLGLDLDLVTLGHGLLIEALPLEGHAGSLSWNGWELREVFGGRTLWFDDDVLAVSVGYNPLALEVMYTLWLHDEETTSSLSDYVDYEWTDTPPPVAAAHYLSLNGEWSWEPFRVAAEVAGRLKGTVLKGAGLLRADYLDALPGGLELHAGYQLRFYQKGFGPRDALITPTATPNLPYREDAYVTNSYEFLGLSKYYHQVSHTGVVEARWRAGAHVGLFGYGEVFLRQIIDPKKNKKVVYVERFGRAPGSSAKVYYRGGLEVYPWAQLPHRFSAYVTNKLVASRGYAVTPDLRRFTTDPLLVLELEVYL